MTSTRVIRPQSFKVDTINSATGKINVKKDKPTKLPTPTRYRLDTGNFQDIGAKLVRPRSTKASTWLSRTKGLRTSEGLEQQLVKEEGLKIRIGDKSLRELLQVEVPETRRQEYIKPDGSVGVRQVPVLDDQGNPVLVKKKLNIPGTVQYFQKSTNEKIDDIEQVLKDTQKTAEEKAEAAIVLLTGILSTEEKLTSTLDKIANLTKLIPVSGKTALQLGLTDLINNRFATAQWIRDNLSIIELVMVANARARGLTPERPIAVMGMDYSKVVPVPIKKPLGIADLAVIGPDEVLDVDTSMIIKQADIADVELKTEEEERKERAEEIRRREPTVFSEARPALEGLLSPKQVIENLTSIENFLEEKAEERGLTSFKPLLDIDGNPVTLAALTDIEHGQLLDLNSSKIVIDLAVALPGFIPPMIPPEEPEGKLFMPPTEQERYPGLIPPMIPPEESIPELGPENRLVDLISTDPNVIDRMRRELTTEELPEINPEYFNALSPDQQNELISQIIEKRTVPVEPQEFGKIPIQVKPPQERFIEGLSTEEKKTYDGMVEIGLTNIQDRGVIVLANKTMGAFNKFIANRQGDIPSDQGLDTLKSRLFGNRYDLKYLSAEQRDILKKMRRSGVIKGSGRVGDIEGRGLKKYYELSMASHNVSKKYGYIRPKYNLQQRMMYC